MKYYCGEEDLKYIIAGYKKINNKIIIRYLDNTTETITDINNNYEDILKTRMINQLIERNKSADIDYLKLRKYLDSMSFISIYILVLVSYFKTAGDIITPLNIANFITGGYAMSRSKTSINTLKDIKKTNLFLEIYKYLEKDDPMNINTLDNYTYKQVKSVYKKVLKKQKTIDN